MLNTNDKYTVELITAFAIKNNINCSIIDAEFSRKCLSIPNNPINESELENYIIGSLNSEVISIQDYKKSKPNWK